jgi:DNA-directed RNA polymerase I subunit RPA2
LCSPIVPPGLFGVKSPYVFPTECRQRGITYKGQLITQLSFKINDVQLGILEKDLGQIPIMVKVRILSLINIIVLPLFILCD